MSIKKTLQLFIILFLSATTFINYSFAQSDELKSLFQSTKSAYKSGELTKALSFAKKAIVISKKEFGLNHKVTGTLISNLGEIQMDLKSFEEAEQTFRESSKIMYEVLEHYDPAIADSISLLALSLNKQSLFKEAMFYHQESLIIMSKAISRDNPTTHGVNENTRKAAMYRARAMFTKAAIEMNNENYESAIGYLKTSVRLFTTSLGRDKSELKETYLMMLEAAHKAKDQKTIDMAKNFIENFM